MTCLDCLYYEVCKEWIEGIASTMYSFDGATHLNDFSKGMLLENLCSKFKNKLKFIELPLRVNEAIDKLFSHNETIALWQVDLNNRSHSDLLWRGVAWCLPEECKKYYLLGFQGIVPENEEDAHTINILVESCISDKK